MGMGQANLAWNELHEVLGHLFWVLCGDETDLPIVVLQTARADRAKRDMLAAVNQHARARKTKPMELAMPEIKWLIDRANALEDDRNNLIHSPLGTLEQTSTEVLPDWFFGNQRALKLKNKDYLKECRRVRDTARMLRDFARDLAIAIYRVARDIAS